MFDDKFDKGAATQEGSQRELIILVDKRKNKEAHIVVSPFESFEDAITTAKRINEGLFEGEWNLYYLDPETVEPISLDRDTNIEEALNKGIDTFYWSKKRSNRSRQKAKKKNQNPFVVEVETGQTFEESKQKARKKRSRFNAQSTHFQQKYRAIFNQSEYASVSKRALALIVDLMVIAVISGVISLGLSFPFIAFLYFTLLESSDYQASLGKMLFKMKVTDQQGDKLSLRSAAIRNLIKAFTLFFPILFVVPAFSKQKQAIHDLFAKTLVKKDWAVSISQ